MKHSFIALLLALALVLSLCACTGTQPANGTQTPAESTGESSISSPSDAPVESNAPETEAQSPETEAPASAADESKPAEAAAVEDTVLELDGCRLRIPAAYQELLIVDTDDSSGALVSVSEKASVEAAQKLHPENTDGAGWLFSLRRVDEAGYIDTITEYMIGVDVVGRGPDGTYYLIGSPTDVRVEREDMSNFGPGSEDYQQWSELCAWAASIPETFCADNGLTPIHLTNTEVDIQLNRLAYRDVGNAFFASLEYGELPLNRMDSSAYLQQLLDGVTFEWVEYADGEEGLTQAPDGEYYCLYLPDEELRIDFFKADGDMVRVLYPTGAAELYRAVYSDSSKHCSDIVAQWLEALSAAEG